jgi:hypothetical protein
MADVKANYHCTELELYAIANLLFNNLEADLAAFAAKKAKYTLLFVTGLRTKRTNAMAQPDEEARNVTHEVLKNKLETEFLPPVLDNFNDLKGYIKDAWPTEDPEPRYEAAGGTKYAKAQAHNWESVVGLNTAMVSFITANNATLLAPGGMPVGFKAGVQSDETDFNTNYASFLAARETGVAREAKVNANNLLFADMADVMEDGAERVWRNDAAKQKNYTFSYLKDLVSPPGSASLTVKAQNAGFIPQAGKTVTIQKAGFAAIVVPTDVTGAAVFLNTPPGKYSGQIDDGAGGITNFEKEIDTGVNARITVTI